mgnify:CR=1 FL=1
MSRLELAADGRGDEEAEGGVETETATSGVEADDEPAVDEHLADLSDGAGCTEIWEHLSEQRGD